jgi:hypothetical protein
MRRAWIWVTSWLLLAFGVVSLLATYAVRGVVVHGEPIGFCMSREPDDVDLSGEVIVRWDAPLIPFGIRCEYDSDSPTVFEFHDFGTGVVVAGLVAVVVAGVGLVVAIVRARRSDKNHHPA